jgi:hypothetical protein
MRGIHHDDERFIDKIRRGSVTLLSKRVLTVRAEVREGEPMRRKIVKGFA